MVVSDLVDELDDAEDVLLLVNDRSDEEGLRREGSLLVLGGVDPVFLRDIVYVKERLRFKYLLDEPDLRFHFLIVTYRELL